MYRSKLHKLLKCKRQSEANRIWVWHLFKHFLFIGLWIEDGARANTASFTKYIFFDNLEQKMYLELNIGIECKTYLALYEATDEWRVLNGIQDSRSDRVQFSRCQLAMLPYMCLLMFSTNFNIYGKSILSISDLRPMWKIENEKSGNIPNTDCVLINFSIFPIKVKVKLNRIVKLDSTDNHLNISMTTVSFILILFSLKKTRKLSKCQLKWIC